jgi:hypothetical protein
VLAEWLVQPWCYTAWAHGELKEAVKAKECAQEVARICKPFDALPLAERRKLAEWLALPWGQAVYAHGKLKEAVAAKECAQEIARICAPFDALPLSERRDLGDILETAQTRVRQAQS